MRDLMISIRLFLVLTVLTGIAYPLAVTAIAQGVAPAQANGSLLMQNGHVVGSALIGQNFDDPKYFWGRISATTPMAYNAASSAGSNLGPTNPALKDEISGRIKGLKESDPTNVLPVPTDLATSSASGLDPHISPEAADYQVPRVARMRHLDEAKVRDLVAQATTSRSFGLLGEPTVNVLKLNLSLDESK